MTQGEWHEEAQGQFGRSFGTSYLLVKKVSGRWLAIYDGFAHSSRPTMEEAMQVAENYAHKQKERYLAHQ